MSWPLEMTRLTVLPRASRVPTLGEVEMMSPTRDGLLEPVVAVPTL